MYTIKHLNKFIVILLMLLLSSKIHAVIWVGGDANCDFTTIQEALDQVELGNDTSIRIASNISGGVYYENLNFDYNLTESIGINGGYDQCKGNSSSTPTEINGSNTGPVLNISGGNVDQKISIGLRVLSFKSGLSDASDRAGGLNISSFNTTVFLTNSSINNNRGVKGGGIYINLMEDSQVFLDSSLVFNNTGTNGGGLYCEGSGDFVFLRENSSIAYNQAESANTAEGNGGGIYATDDCFISMSTGDDLFSSVKGVVGNQAANHGGGVFLSNSAYLNLTKRNLLDGSIEFAAFKENSADSDNNGIGDGGAIYLRGSTTKVNASDAFFQNNTAVNGGAIAVISDADASFLGSENGCLFDGHCIKFSDNTAGANISQVGKGIGGVLYANNNKSALFARTLLTGNSADSGIVAGVAEQGRMDITSSNINNNGNTPNASLTQNSLFTSINSGSQLILSHVTIADNSISSGSTVFLAAFGSTIKTFNSIIQDTNDIMESFNISGSQVNLLFDCNVVHEKDSLGGTVGNNFVTTFLNFVDQVNGDYRVQSPSIAIDLCSQTSSTFIWPDFEGQVFGYDDPDEPNLFGAHDAGADESYLSDIIFANGF